MKSKWWLGLVGVAVMLGAVFGVLVFTHHASTKLVPSLLVSVTTHNSATKKTDSLNLFGFAGSSRPTCQVKSVGTSKILIVVATAGQPNTDQLQVTVGGYHGDGVYTVPNAKGATSVTISMTGTALAKTKQTATDPTLGFQVGGSVTVSDSGKMVSFSGGDSHWLSTPSIGTVKGHLTC